MPRYRLRHAVISAFLLVAMLGQGTWALAGTTGGLSGVVYEAGGTTPLANAQVTATSPSQTATTQSDATGHFSFISLSPDTYSVTVAKQGYDTASQGGITVFADQTQTIALSAHKTALKEIGAVTSRTASDLVKAGTTSDVYSVTSAMQDKSSALGGGGSLNSAYSAIASVPGAFVPLSQTGYFQTVHIRGGDYDQVGYELDGVPVNRSFDNYPSGAASSLGQQELQVYTGANPANSEGQGLAGYINQVIRTGTFPGFANAAIAVGAPAFYHKLSVEAGGATPNRMFSYYVGMGGYGQDFRYVDQSNAAKYQYLGPPAYQLAAPASGAGSCADPATPYSSCYANGVAGPGGYAQLPYQYGFLSNLMDRDVVANVHVGIPHRHDSLRDDIQILFDNGHLSNSFYSSTNDAGGPAFWAPAGGNPTFADSFAYTGPVGVALPANPGNYVGTYLYPNSPGQRTAGMDIPFDARDATQNNQSVLKLQYQKNFSSNAYLRLYGYTYYSDWLQYGPNGADLNYIGTGASPDYELSSHTRGVSAQLADQINSEHLLSLQGSYVTASTLRDNNTQMFNGGGTRSRFAVLTDPNAINNPGNPDYGVCYTYTGTGTAVPTSCSVSAHPATFYTYSCAAGVSASCVSPAAAAGDVCGTGPCTYYVAENGLYATYNTVKPTFSAVSLTDQWRPTDKWLFNLGIREDGFKFQGSNTVTDNARAFWFASWNLDHCVSTATGAPFDKVTQLGLGSPTAACPTGYTAANMQNIPNQVEQYNVFQPRISGTYTANADTVIRFSGGKYVEPPNAAYEQYNTLQENLPNFLGTAFYKFGFTTPGHEVRPPVSYNFDLSYERHIKGTDMSVKLTPFVRKTRDQIQNFFLDQASGFVSGLNVGRQTSQGFELQFNKGDFNKNGLAGSLAFTYTNSYIKYDTLQNGASIVSGMNADIQQYNAYTKGCAATYVSGTPGNPAHNTNSLCGVTTSGANTAPCFMADGTPDPACAPGSIGNPYWNAPTVGTLDPNANYPTYDIFPGPIGSSAQAFGAPYVATLLLNWKHDKLAITPSFQFVAGSRYGAPETTPGIDPAAGCNPLAVAPGAPDPRYPYGNPGGAASAYDAVTCAASLNAIPDPYTGVFDTLGAFRQPSQLTANMQVSYQASNRIQLVGTFANILNSCFGGDSKPWTISDKNVCSYGTVNNAGAFPPVGNFYNPGTPIQQFVKYPYGAYLGAVNVDGNSTKTPFNFFVEARIKL